MILYPSLIFLAGLTTVIMGAELLLRGASRLATLMGIPPIIIGLTVVSIGTSTPELAVGITAALEGRGALAVGNIAGTNIFNILFILGISAIIRPLPMQLLSIKFDVPVMIVAAVALAFMAQDGVLSAGEGALLVAAAIVYTAALIRLSRKENTATLHEYEKEFREPNLVEDSNTSPHARTTKVLKSFILLILGLALTLLGAEWLVVGAVKIAYIYGLSDAIIGLTIVAIGTSAPELATTLVATLKKKDRDVAIGNLIGSSIYNILMILGFTCIASPQGVNISGDVLRIDLPLAAAVAVACFPVFKSNQLVSRREGMVFVATYLVYFISLVFYRS